MNTLLKMVVGALLGAVILILYALVGPVVSYLMAHVVQAVFPSSVTGFMHLIGATITFPQLAAVLAFLGVVTFPRSTNTKVEKQ